jgi:hypothetical protein
MTRLTFTCSVALTMFMASVPAFSDVIFTDTTFNLADYTVTTPFKSDSASTVSDAQCASCGNPGQALQILMSLPNSGDEIALGFINNTFSYNPLTQGAISTISASADKNITLNQSGTDLGNTFRPLIEQDGNFYLAAIPGPAVTGSTTGFNTLSQAGLTASSFQRFDFSTGAFVAGSPNFSGDAMLFGLGQVTILGGEKNVSFEADYDNLKLDIVSTPEPSTLKLLAGLLALLAAFGLARRPRSITVSPAN